MLVLQCLVVLMAAGVALSMTSGPVPRTEIVCRDISPSPGPHGPPQSGNGGYVIATDASLALDNGLYSYTAGQSYNSEYKF